MENNKLIAEFMGANPFRESVSEDIFSYELYGVLECIEDGENEKHFFLPEEMEFHESWNWLMPVVEKIESLRNDGIDVNIFTDGTIIEDWRTNTELVRMTKAEIGFDKKIEHTYKAVVEFIKKHK